MVEAPVEMLAVYGSLAPGESNHWILSRIAGDWQPGTVKGHRFEITWGPAEGYDGFVVDSVGGVDVEVWVLASKQLEKEWPEIDEFEGEGYERQEIAVTLASGEQAAAQIYVTLTNS